MYAVPTVLARPCGSSERLDCWIYFHDLGWSKRVHLPIIQLDMDKNEGPDGCVQLPELALTLTSASAPPHIQSTAGLSIRISRSIAQKLLNLYSLPITPMHQPSTAPAPVQRHKIVDEGL